MAPPTRGTTTANASILEQISGRKKAKIRIKISNGPILGTIWITCPSIITLAPDKKFPLILVTLSSSLILYTNSCLLIFFKGVPFKINSFFPVQKLSLYSIVPIISFNHSPFLILYHIKNIFKVNK